VRFEFTKIYIVVDSEPLTSLELNGIWKLLYWDNGHSILYLDAASSVVSSRNSDFSFSLSEVNGYLRINGCSDASDAAGLGFCGVAPKLKVDVRIHFTELYDVDILNSMFTMQVCLGIYIRNISTLGDKETVERILNIYDFRNETVGFIHLRETIGTELVLKKLDNSVNTTGIIVFTKHNGGQVQAVNNSHTFDYVLIKRLTGKFSDEAELTNFPYDMQILRASVRVFIPRLITLVPHYDLPSRGFDIESFQHGSEYCPVVDDGDSDVVADSESDEVGVAVIEDVRLIHLTLKIKLHLKFLGIESVHELLHSLHINQR